MPKATLKRKYLLRGLLTVSEAESMAVGRHGAGEVAESSILSYKQNDTDRQTDSLSGSSMGF